MAPTSSPIIAHADGIGLSAGPACATVLSRACGTLVISCFVPVLLVASSIPAMMLRRNTHYMAFIRRQHAKTFQRISEVTALSEAFPGLRTPNSSVGNCLMQSKDRKSRRSSALLQPSVADAEEPIGPVLTLSLSDSFALQLGFISFGESVMSQLAGRSHDNEIASRSSPTLGGVALAVQRNPARRSQDSIPTLALDFTRGGLSDTSSLDPQHSRYTLEMSLDATRFVENISQDETFASSKDQIPIKEITYASHASITLDRSKSVARLPEEVLMTIPSPLGLSDSDMILPPDTDGEVMASVSSADLGCKSFASLAALPSLAQSTHLDTLSRRLNERGYFLHRASQSCNALLNEAAANISSFEFSGPGELWDEDDESIFSCRTSLAEVDDRRNLSSIAESLLLHDAGELWDTDDEQLFSNIERFASLSTYASLGIASLEIEIEQVPPLPHIQMDRFSERMDVLQGGGFSQNTGGNALSPTALAMSEASIPQSSLASGDGLQMLDIGTGFEESIRNELLPQTSLGALASQTSSIWSTAQSTTHVSISTLARESTNVGTSSADSMSLASVVDVHIVTHSSVHAVNAHLPTLGHGEDGITHVHVAENDSHIKLTSDSCDDKRCQRLSMCMDVEEGMDVEEDQSFNCTISPRFFGTLGKNTLSKFLMGPPVEGVTDGSG